MNTTNKPKPTKVIEVILREKGNLKKKKAPRLIPSHKGKILTTIALTGMVLGTTACGGTGFQALSGGYDLELRASEKGLQAWDEYTNGVISNSRIDPNLESPQWKLKREREQYKMLIQQSKKAQKGGR